MTCGISLNSAFVKSPETVASEATGRWPEAQSRGEEGKCDVTFLARKRKAPHRPANQGLSLLIPQMNEITQQLVMSLISYHNSFI